MAKRAKGTSEFDSDPELLRDWCIAVIRYVRERAGPGWEPMADGMERTVQDEYESGRLSGLRAIRNDLREMARGATPAQQQELDEILRAKTGWGLRNERRSFEQKVAVVLERGEIRNEDEARLLLERADEIYADEAKKAEMESINRLLAAYEGGG